MSPEKEKGGHGLLVYSVAHFVVDFSCAFIMAGMVMEKETGAALLLIYNFCAFAMQIFIGIAADYINKNAVVATAGCIFVALSCFFHENLIIVVIIAGLGNAMFHIGAGVDILNSGISSSKIFPAGMFVSMGAFGIYLGKVLGSKAYMQAVVIILLFVMALLVLLTAAYSGKLVSSGNMKVSFSIKSTWHYISAIMFFGVVVIRSYMGMVMHFPWQGSIACGALLITIMTVSGKCLGGVFADKAGSLKASIISLAGAALLFMFSSNVIAGLLAVFLFQMTMPVTLWFLAGILDKCRGFAFGILTFALFAGYYASYRKTGIFLQDSTILSVISLVMMVAGIITFYAGKGKGECV